MLSGQVCDFWADCLDNTDEADCPAIFLFDFCDALTGQADCGWREEPKDELDWVVADT